MITETSPTILIHCIFSLLFCGVVVASWGKKLPGRGIWLIWAGLITLLIGIGLDAGVFLQQTFKTKVWMVGWVLSRDEIGAITVGVFQDSLSLTLTVLAACLAGVLLMNGSTLFRESRPERVFAAVAISTAGVALAWNALTPWIVFSGLSLTLLGGLLSLGSRGDIQNGANIVARFGWERSWGFILSFFGACIIATTRNALVLNQADIWITQNGNVYSTWIGCGLLIIGLFIQMQPFPFLGWLVSTSEHYPPAKTLLNQVFPAWAAFALLFRLEPQLRAQGLFPAFGWIALCSTLFSVLSGLIQKQWRVSLGTWLSAGISLSIALLALSGPLPALGILLGVSLGAMVLSGSAWALEGHSSQNIAFKNRAYWIKGSAFVGAAAGTGVIGFISALGGLRWIANTMDLPGLVALFLFIFFLFVILGWKLAWNISRMQDTSDVPWLSILSLYLPAIFSLGIVWTGTITGDVILGTPDRLLSTSIFDFYFGTQIWNGFSEAAFISASGLYWGALVLGFTTAYWTVGRKGDLWMNLGGGAPRLTEFLATGYGVDGILRRALLGVSWIGKRAELLIDYKIWGNWIPKGLDYAVTAVSGSIRKVDEKLSSSIDRSLRRMVEVPAKILQLIQTGDIRWYLFFALGSSFALLLHFLKT